MTPHFKNLKKVLLSEIETAEKSLFVAVAWFTDQDILNLLIAKRKQGLKVVLVISNDDNNFIRTYSLNFETFKEVGGVMLVVEKAFMHHKFSIIDEQTLITGTANYTYNGFYKNSENLMVITDPSTISEFLNEFKALTEFYEFENGLVLTNDKLKLEIEIKWAIGQIDFLEQDLAQAEKALELYEIKYRMRFRSLILEILHLQTMALQKQAVLTDKKEDKLRYEAAQKNYQHITETETNDKAIESQSKDSNIQKTIKELFREAVKLCHPDNAFISENQKDKAQQIFIKLKAAFTNNNIKEVESILENLKSGVALGNTDYDGMNSESLLELLGKLKVRIQSLADQIYSIKNDKRYLLILDENALNIHFSEQEELLGERLRNLQ
ncbi:MAG: phospholipase D-like domain-containing protein [Leadbetterella sp.]|nr:phospholipase D-like domain-containing protein [Leadbetterella sp.]